MSLRRDWEALDELVHAALSVMDARVKGYPVELRIPADLPQLWVDAKLTVQLFCNLLDNIAKYTPAGTRVTIAAVPEGAFVRISVDDTGPGLPPGDPARLFEKFQRGNGEGTIVGVGLGLAICRAIVRAHGGDIEARQRPGGGARLEFTLPAISPAEEPANSQPSQLGATASTTAQAAALSRAEADG